MLKKVKLLQFYRKSTDNEYVNHNTSTERLTEIQFYEFIATLHMHTKY